MALISDSICLICSTNRGINFKSRNILWTSLIPTIDTLPDTSTKSSENTIIPGNPKNYIKEWFQATSDKITVDALTNFHVELDSMPISNKETF